MIGIGWVQSPGGLCHASTTTIQKKEQINPNFDKYAANIRLSVAAPPSSTRIPHWLIHSVHEGV
jgi:hypothetical protein